MNSPAREFRVKYRRPHGTEWEELDLDDGHGHDRRPGDRRPGRDLGGARRGRSPCPLARTRGLAFLGGATLDNEENYLIKKLFTALGAVQIENQARI